MTGKIEEVARAICKLDCPELVNIGRCDCHQWHGDSGRALAAIAALRTLTPAQERAVALASCEQGKQCDCSPQNPDAGTWEPCLARARRAWAAGLKAMETKE